MNWKDAISEVEQYSISDSPLPIKRKPKSPACVVCFKSIGGLVTCKGCESKSVHKKCGKLDSDDWYCSNDCRFNPSIKRCRSTASETNSLSLPSPQRSFSAPVRFFSIPDITTDEVFTRILEECKSDPVLLNLILCRQQEWNRVQLEIEKQTSNLNNSNLSSQEFRVKSFKLHDYEKKRKETIKKDLIDQLLCAQFIGFETVMRLKKMYGKEGDEPDLADFEKRKKLQKEVAEKLLTADMREYKLAHDLEDARCKSSSQLINSLLNPKNPNNLESLIRRKKHEIISTTIDRSKLNAITPDLFIKLSRIIIDCTIANCRYLPGQKIEYSGGGTDPVLLSKLLYSKMECIHYSATRETAGTNGYPVLPNIHTFKVKVAYDNLGFIKNFAEREIKLPSINHKEMHSSLNTSQIQEHRSRAQSRDSRTVTFNRRPGTKYRSLSPVNEECTAKNEIQRPITRKIGTRAEFGLKL